MTDLSDVRKALSGIQPWWWLLVQKHKPIENRRWHFPPKLIGERVLLHASKTLSRQDYAAAVSMAFDIDPTIAVPGLDKLERGGIIGVARVTTCLCPASSGQSFARPEDHPWWMPEQHGFVLTDVEPLPFTPWKGALGLWAVTDELRREIAARRAA